MPGLPASSPCLVGTASGSLIPILNRNLLLSKLSWIGPFHERHKVTCRGGLHWRKLMTRPAAIGFSEHVDAPVNPDFIETKMDCASGASMYVTRCCINQIGLMDERFFLYYEDLDWGLRA